MKTILEVKNLRKSYGDVRAVQDISFAIQGGEIVGLLGPNGAGKTTTISMILGILEPDQGSVTISGMELATHRQKILEKVNFAAVYSQLPGNLTVAENLTFFALLYGVADIPQRLETLMREYDLTSFRNTRSGLLSSGESSRLHIAKALLNNPELLLLDEPTASLDPSGSQIVRERFKEYTRKQNIGILWTSHDMKEIELVCDRVLFISHGKILVEGKPKELPERYGKKDLEELFIFLAREPLTTPEL